MTQRPVTVGLDTTLAEAAELMATHGVGALPVMADGRLVGMVTEADVLRRLGRSPAPQSVRAAIAAETVSVSPNTPVEKVAELMARLGISRVPVVAWGNVVGVASQLDMLAAAVGRRHESTQRDVRFGWRFLGPARRLREAESVVAAPGLRLHTDPDLVPFEDAPAAFSDILAALGNGRGLVACRVRLSGLVVAHGDREAATDWECLWLSDCGATLVGWAAEAVLDLMDHQHRADRHVTEVLHAIIRGESGEATEAEISRGIRSIRAARLAGLQLQGVTRALDAVLEATQAALAAREATRGMDRVWENIAVASAWDAAREAVRLLGPDYGQTLRQRLESAALASASVLANLG